MTQSLNPLDIIAEKKQKKEMWDWFPRLHDVLMSEYGWIPLSDLEGLDVKGEVEFQFPVVLKRWPWSKPKIRMIPVKGKIKLDKESLRMGTMWSLYDQIVKRRERERKEIKKQAKKQSRMGRKI